MSICTRWWLRHFLKCQARKTPRLTVRWPVNSITLRPGLGIAVSVDKFEPLPVTPRGNTHTSKYILLFTDRFSRCADIFVITAAEFRAEGTANILINRYIPRWGCPRSILSDNGLLFCSNFFHVVYEILGVQKIATSYYHPSGNGGVEHVNHTMAQMLAMVVNERHDDWDAQLPYVEFAYNSSVSAATALAPNEVHMGRLPRLPLTICDRPGVAGHQSLARDHLAYCYLASERQQRANDIVREMHALTVSRVERRNSALSDALRQVSNFIVGNWVWLYSTASIIRKSAKAGTDAKVLKTKFALNLTGPYKILANDPCPSSDTPDGSPLGDKLLYLDLPADVPGADAHRRVSVERCKPCANPHDRGDMPKYLPMG